MCNGDHIYLGNISNTHQHPVLIYSLFIPKLLFRVTNMSSRTSIKYPGAAMSISKEHINNTYIKYTFVHFAILLIYQVLGVVPLSIAVEALGFRLGSSFGLLHGSGNLLAILIEVPSLSLALFLETSGLVNHQHLMLLLDFYHRRFQHREELRNHFRHPLHIIVHHEVPVTWR